MNQDKFKKLYMPKYSRGEDIFNYVSHIVAASLGIISLIMGIIFFIKGKINLYGLISMIIFSITCVTVYTISSVYHGLHYYLTSRKVFRIIDHCAIYLLVAGTYTPICVIGLHESVWQIIILIIEWSFAVIGILMNAIDLENKLVKILSMILYIIGGWLIIIFPAAINLISFTSFLFILLGGIAYTLGAILYGIGSKKKWFHSIFHIFCLFGTLLQIIGIFLLCI